MPTQNLISPLVSTDWLSARLDERDLRLLDATVHFTRQDDGRMSISSGRESYDTAHIPRAQFADLLTDLSDPQSKLMFALPSEQQFAAAMEALGVSDSDRVVIYSAGYSAWATRVWWLLGVFGFSNAAVLNGGFAKWQREGRPVTADTQVPNEAIFRAKLDHRLVANKQDVLDAVKDDACRTSIIDALPPEHFRGETGDSFGYGRVGHISGAVNIPTDALVDQQTGEFFSLLILEEKFSDVLQTSSHIINYCGGGIAATQNAFALKLLGKDDVAVYDGSLQEWAQDENLPMEV